jgi:hypothetical protein
VAKVVEAMEITAVEAMEVMDAEAITMLTKNDLYEDMIIMLYKEMVMIDLPF